eukprot:Skav206911  [mRNA]  locus=scaffold808:332320:333552:+ [translate_table: standard]
MAIIPVGSLAFIDYGEVPRCVHTRLIVGHIEADEYQILTPDFDCYIEQISSTNGDIVQFWLGQAGGGIPAGVPNRSVYGFRPMSANEFANRLAAGAALADAERQRRGLPVAGAVAPAPGAPAAAGPAANPGDGKIWVIAEHVEGRKIGEKVFPPVGHLCDGDWGLMRISDSKNVERPVLIGLVSEADLGTFCEQRIAAARSSEAIEGDDFSASDDVRTLEVTYGLNGERQRGFRESVKQLQQVEFSDFPFEPRTCLEYVRAVSSIAESATAQHHMWVGSSKIPDGDRSIHEDEVLARIFDAAICYDCLNISNLSCMELVCRRRQLIAEAHSHSPAAPSYVGVEHFLGQTYKAGGGVVVPSLSDYVSKQLHAQAQIMKEKRKMSEAKGVGKGGKDKTGPKAPAKPGGGGGQ